MQLYHLSTGAGENIDGIYSSLEKAMAAYVGICALASRTFEETVTPEEFVKLSDFQYRAPETKNGLISVSYIVVHTLDATPFNNL